MDRRMNYNTYSCSMIATANILPDNSILYDVIGCVKMYPEILFGGRQNSGTAQIHTVELLMEQEKRRCSFYFLRTFTFC